MLIAWAKSGSAMLRGTEAIALMEDHFDAPQCALESLAIAHITLNPLDVACTSLTRAGLPPIPLSSIRTR